MKGLTKDQFSRLRLIVALETATGATYEAWNSEIDPKTKEEYRRTVGTLHGICERLKRRWKVT